MPARDRLRILAILTPSTIVAFALTAAPALADSCAEADCKPAATAAAPQQPLKLQKFRRQPVALGKPTRVAKTPKGHYTRVKLTRRAKPQPAAAATPEPPQFMPVVVSPEAAAALAMQATVAQAAGTVRVVDADEFNELDSAADPPLNSATPLVPVRVPTDRITSAFAPLADRTTPTATAPTIPAAQVAPTAAPATVAVEQADTGLRAWLSRLGAWCSDRLSSLAALVRSLFV